jgi:hypothetical protein
LLQTGETVNWSVENDKVKVNVPSSVIKMNKALPALAFSFTPSE